MYSRAVGVATVDLASSFTALSSPPQIRVIQKSVEMCVCARVCKVESAVCEHMFLLFNMFVLYVCGCVSSDVWSVTLYLCVCVCVLCALDDINVFFSLLSFAPLTSSVFSSDDDIRSLPP